MRMTEKKTTTIRMRHDHTNKIASKIKRENCSQDQAHIFCIITRHAKAVAGLHEFLTGDLVTTTIHKTRKTLK